MVDTASPPPPGVVKIVPAGLPQANLVAKQRETPDLDLTTDREWPDMTLARGAEVDGIVVDETGQPVVGAEVYLLDGGPRRQEEIIRTGAGGRFHFDQLDPDAMISLWARSKIATTNGAMLSRPGNRPGRLTLTIDPRFAAQIRGMAVDETGKRVARAHVKLWWARPYSSPGGETELRSVTIMTSYVTTENGWFVFRGVWPGLEYGIEAIATGYRHAQRRRSSARPERRLTSASWFYPRRAAGSPDAS